MKKTAIGGVIILTMLIVAGCMQVPTSDEKVVITNFEECVAAGNPVMESYPRQCNANGETFVEEIEQPVESAMTEEEARVIAEANCIKGGEALGTGSYNPNSKTWWFDANLNATQPGCNPACVVWEETGLSEINWRCTGLILPEESAEVDSEAALREAFAVKYPDYSQTLSVKITKETDGFARGNIDFVEGEAGGYFLAKMTNGVWEIVMDGNGQIPCNLSEQGFPEDMLTDCAE